MVFCPTACCEADDDDGGSCRKCPASSDIKVCIGKLLTESLAVPHDCQRHSAEMLLLLCYKSSLPFPEADFLEHTGLIKQDMHTMCCTASLPTYQDQKFCFLQL